MWVVAVTHTAVRAFNPGASVASHTPKVRLGQLSCTCAGTSFFVLPVVQALLVY
jgi:hypothetical protein